MTGGELAKREDAAIEIHGVSFDNREEGLPGKLFLPLIAARNGHQYVAEAAAKGAAGSLWQKDQGEPPAGVPVVLVDDTMAAFQRLAREYRRQIGVRVVGITGSNGKTTTKDFVFSILSTTYKTYKTQGNLNNHQGVPYTLLSLDEDTQMAVVEMGMSGRGEIELLTSIAEPDAAIITNIGEAHLLQLGSREEIGRAKLEILSGLRSGGFFVYHGDEPLVERLLPEMPHPEEMLRYRFGRSNANDLYPTGMLTEEDGMHFTVSLPDFPPCFIPVLGEHNVVNALAAIAVGKYMGVTDEDVVVGLRFAEMTGMRIERISASSGALLLNDAYNASPLSTKASLELFRTLPGASRKLAVLADMLELGPEEEEYHREIGRLLDPGSFTLLFTYGPLAKFIAEEAAPRLGAGRVAWFADKADLIAALRAEVRDGDAVLFKGSRGMALEDAVQALL